MFLSLTITHITHIDRGIDRYPGCRSLSKSARSRGRSGARLTCRICVPVRSFRYLGGPARVHGRSFFKRVFSSACTRRARALFFIMSGYPSSSLLVVFSVGAGERKKGRQREKETGRMKENARKKGGGKGGKSRLSLEYCLNRPRTFPHEAILLPLRWWY